MGAGKLRAGRRKWLDLLLWWRIDPEELRLQVEGYETLRTVFAVRRLGFLLAAVSAAEAAYFAVLTFLPGTASLFPIACFQAGVAGGLLALGGLLLRGNRVATLGLMALCTIQIAFVAAYGANASFSLLSMAGWAITMRVFTLSLRVERSRKGVA